MMDLNNFLTNTVPLGLQTLTSIQNQECVFLKHPLRREGLGIPVKMHIIPLQTTSMDTSMVITINCEIMALLYGTST